MYPCPLNITPKSVDSQVCYFVMYVFHIGLLKLEEFRAVMQRADIGLSDPDILSFIAQVNFMNYIYGIVRSL
jgi:hypothetical protein